MRKRQGSCGGTPRRDGSGGGVGNRGTSKQPKLGTGARFKALESKLESKKGISDAGALAAYIGRKKLGKERFQELSAKGRRGRHGRD